MVQEMCGGQCIHVGAAGALQRACDTNRLHGSVSMGAATYCFIKAFEEKEACMSYSELLTAMQAGLENLKGAGRWRKCMRLLGRNMQTPCICASEPLRLDCTVSL